MPCDATYLPAVKECCDGKILVSLFDDRSEPIEYQQVLLGKVESKSQNVPLPHRLPVEVCRFEDPFLGCFFRRRAERGMTAGGLRLNHPPVLVNCYRHLNFA